MNLILFFIIIGLCIMHFGFWTVIGSFFVGLFWLVVFLLIIAAFVFSIIYIIENYG